MFKIRPLLAQTYIAIQKFGAFFYLLFYYFKFSFFLFNFFFFNIGILLFSKGTLNKYVCGLGFFFCAGRSNLQMILSLELIIFYDSVKVIHKAFIDDFIVFRSF